MSPEACKNLKLISINSWEEALLGHLRTSVLKPQRVPVCWICNVRIYVFRWACSTWLLLEMSVLTVGDNLIFHGLFAAEWDRLRGYGPLPLIFIELMICFWQNWGNYATFIHATLRTFCIPSSWDWASPGPKLPFFGHSTFDPWCIWVPCIQWVWNGNIFQHHWHPCNSGP